MLAARPGSACGTRRSRTSGRLPTRWSATTRLLRADHPVGFGWMTQDLHASGALGDASLATRGKRRGGARPRRARLSGAAQGCGEIRPRRVSRPVRSDKTCVVAARHNPGGTHERRRYCARAEDKRLNSLVAITVVILTVFMAITKIKDDNINQAMQKAKADSVDAWAEYQFARVKLHVDENGLSQLRLLEIGRPERQGTRRQAGRRIRSRHQEIRGPFEGDARQGREARSRIRPAQLP